MLKAMRRRNGGHILSNCRRIEAVHPIKGKPRLALVFPMAPRKDVTESQLAALAEAKVTVTFAVFGAVSAEQKDYGVAALPELLLAIGKAGHSVSGLGHSARPLARSLFSLRETPHADSIAAYEDYLALKHSVEAIGNRQLSFLTPIGDRESTKDETSVFDVFAALDSQLLTYAFDLSRLDDEKATKALYNLLLKKPAQLNGRTVALPPCFSASALRKVLGWINDRGFEAVSVDTLTSDSPFADAVGDSAADAAHLLAAGYTVATRENKLLLEQTLTRAELYGMLVPREIRQDYLTSRLLKKEAAFACNKRKDKEYYLVPGRVSSAGMLFAFDAGWPLANKHSVLMPADFADFLEKAAAGKTVQWAMPDGKQLKRRDVFPALAQLLLVETGKDTNG